MRQFTSHPCELVNVNGNDYGLMVATRYDKGIMFVRFVGTHREYGRINAEEV